MKAKNFMREIFPEASVKEFSNDFNHVVWGVSIGDKGYFITSGRNEEEAWEEFSEFIKLIVKNYLK